MQMYESLRGQIIFLDKKIFNNIGNLFKENLMNLFEFYICTRKERFCWEI